MTPEERRFWGFVDITPGCWLWTGHLTRDGYGKTRHEGRTGALAHRVSWQRRHGAISSTVYVCHRCDTPACVNPDHLFLGSQVDNMADMKAKGRANRPRGTRNPRATLTDAQVVEIRRRRASGEQLRALAKEFGSTVSTIFNVSNRVTWKHLP